MSAERLQKVLASAGIASRRDCEELIAAGRVTVNGRVVHELGTRVDLAHDLVAVDGKPVQQPGERTYILLNKPVGVVSTVDDPQGRATVVDLVAVAARIFPVGRLDVESEGLLLLTDDGELTHHLTHPSFAVEKEYRALLDRAPTASALREWRAGVLLEGERTAPAWVEVLERTDEGAWVRVVLREGRKRQIREVARLLGYAVQRLIRVREGNLLLGDLPSGQWRPLTPEEIQDLRAHISTPPREAAPEPEPAASARPPVTRPRRQAAVDREPRATTPRRTDERTTPERRANATREREPDRDWSERRDRRDDQRGDRRDRRDDQRGDRRDERGDERGDRRDERGEQPRQFRRPRVGDRPTGERSFGERSERPRSAERDRPQRADEGEQRNRREGTASRQRAPLRSEGRYGGGNRRDERYGDRRDERYGDRRYEGGGRGEGQNRTVNERYADLYPRGSRQRGDGPPSGGRAYGGRRRDTTPGAEGRPTDGNRAERPANREAPAMREVGNERPRPTRSPAEEKPAPGRAWRERQDEEARARQNRNGGRSQRSGRSVFRSRPEGRPNFPVRPRTPRSDDNEE